MNNAFATASLYVGDLHSEVTEALLFELFNAVGPVASIRVCRDSVSRRSLGYAYVNFHSVVDAERALETMNYTLIKNKPCRIMWCHRDPSLRKSGTGNVFIKNLDKSIDNKALYDTFSAFGNILSCKVATDESGASKGYGFVHYETQEAAQMAVTRVNGMLLNGKKVFVGFFVPRKDRADTGSAADATFTNVFVKSLPLEIDDEGLKGMFTPFGEIKSALVMKDPEGKSRGFGFVNFADHDEATKAKVQAIADSGAAPLAKFAVSWPLAYHFCGACRHAVWDLKGYGFTNAMMLQSSYAVMGASLAIAFLATSASLPADKKE